MYKIRIMEKQRTKPGESNDPVLQEIPKACQDESAAVEFLEKQRWGDKPACPHCGDTNVAKLTDGQGNRNKRFLWRCHGCKRQFTVRIGTVFEDSRIPLKIWCHAFWRACSSKKGVSALQISRECAITYKTALFLMHRIRYAMTEPEHENKLKGTVEVDEAYIGGKPRNKGKNPRGRGTSKTPVLVMVERKGNARTRVPTTVTGDILKGAIFENVHLCSTIMTDENICYNGIGGYYSGGHKTANHSKGEYVKPGGIHSNTAESFFALFKRGVYGTFHAISKKHLHRYAHEFSFRWNTRDLNDGERIAKAIKKADGKRLIYREPISKTA